MTTRKPGASELIAEVLAGGGRISLATLLDRLASLEELRELARRLGLTPKGYRVERAPPKVLIAMLTDGRNPAVVEEVVALVAERLTLPARSPEVGSSGPGGAAGSMLRLREQELEQSHAALHRSRDLAARQRQKEAELTRRIDASEQREARLRGEIDELHRRIDARADGSTVPLDQRRRIHELEREIDALGEAVDGLRRLLALRAARMREDQAQIVDLESRVPKGRRRKAPSVEEPLLAPEFRLPYFTQAFYRSLEDKDRRSVGKVVQAVLLFCTEGPAYPGLEVKQIEGQNLWSMRASLKLRVYFQFRDDGDVDIVAVADREDQHTTLRRLKER